MAKLIKIQGFKTAIRVDRIDAVDQIQNAKGEHAVRVFMSGMSDGYTLNFCAYEDLADKCYEDIVKAIEEI